jgi:hypothetical protein
MRPALKFYKSQGSPMNKIRVAMVIAALVSCFVATRVSIAQVNAMESAPAFNGGVFVTPVAGAPFSAEVQQDMTQELKHGRPFHRKTAALIARDSQGRICNERRQVLPASSKQKPGILSIHLYDPETRLNTYLNPGTHIARQSAVDHPPSTEPPNVAWLRQVAAQPSHPNLRVKDLGPSVMEGVDVHGYRSILTVPAQASGTDHPVVVTDEYWYSEELHLNLLTRHSDPRTGDLVTTVTQINVNEPDADLFAIPPEYKLVDMTPPSMEPQGAVRVEP